MKQLLSRSSFILIIALACTGCGKTSGPGTLRGGSHLAIRPPIVIPAKRESITLNDEKRVTRAFVPATVGTVINSVPVQEPLWTDLEQFRHDWCQQPPAFVSLEPTDQDYRVILSCGRADDPSYFIRPADLPAPLRALIALVPSTDERVLPQ